MFFGYSLLFVGTKNILETDTAGTGQCIMIDRTGQDRTGQDSYGQKHSGQECLNVGEKNAAAWPKYIYRKIG